MKIAKLMVVWGALAAVALLVTCSPSALLTDVQDKVHAAQAAKIQTVSSPTFSPTTGTYSSDLSVTITEATPGAVIHYSSATGSSIPPDPTSASSAYSSPIAVSGNGTITTIKAIATESGMNDSQVVTAIYTINYSQVSTPNFTPQAGGYQTRGQVTLTITSSAGASIYYTTDGSTPTKTTGQSYTAPFNVTASEKITAIAYEAGMTDSTVAIATYTLQDATPTLSPVAGTYTTPQSVSISTTMPGAVTIRYTTDGSIPSSTLGTPYSGPVSVAASETLQAVAYESGWADSAVAPGAYTITGTVVTPTFNPLPPGFGFTSAQNVAISSTTPGASFRFTTDGSTPTSTSGTSYSGPVNIAMNLTLKAIAYEAGWADSGVYSYDYYVEDAMVTTLAGASYTMGHSDGTGGAAQFYGPSGITTDGTNLYVADAWNATIRKIVISSGVVTTLAGTAGTPGNVDGTGSGATAFMYPRGITISGNNLYVADTQNCTIRKIVISTAVVTTLAGSGGPGSINGTGSAASFYEPYGITTDGTDLYVADTVNNTIRKIVISTAVVTTLAGTAGSSGWTDGTGSAARFNYPNGITTDGTNLYVSDTNNNTIRKIVISTGAVTTLAGSAGSSGWTDGTGSAARFCGPCGIATDGTNLYVADSNYYTIRKIVISTGAVTTLAGYPRLNADFDGTGAAGRFDTPYGIVMSGTSLYVADQNDETIRVVR